MLHEFDNTHANHAALTIYHNPACSKSRETLALIREHGVEPRVVEYLKTPPDQATLRTLIERLNIRAEDLVRREEAEFKEHFAGKQLDEAGWIQALADHPRLIQRPIVISGEHGILGRPPANVLPLLKAIKKR